jgi:dTDP-4-amino-4,6-dideoxygalactose transaminase
MLNVTKPYFPPLEEYSSYLKRIWKNEWLTNRGELLLELESRLTKYLEVNNIIIMNNGTIPIQIALSSLPIGSEVITTPFSYVATTSAIIWQNLIPKFVDIDENFLTIDENKIESKISKKTKCILATHVFGNPCNIDRIQEIANKHNLLIIYDAAHCFGVKYNGNSIFNYGNISTCSFHATKLFHTGEGGAIFCNDNQELRDNLFYSHNFGHINEYDFAKVGINGKISELQSAMGLTVLDHIDDIISSRKKSVEYYNANLKFKYYIKFILRPGTDWNYSYYPIIFNNENDLLKILKIFKENNISPRRYFYPSLNTLPYLKDKIKMPVSESISSRILCLPLFTNISQTELDNVIKILNSF